jgi:hypothetical protein
MRCLNQTIGGFDGEVQWKDLKELGGITTHSEGIVVGDGRFDGREHSTIYLEASVEMRGSDVEHVLGAVLAVTV